MGMMGVYDDSLTDILPMKVFHQQDFSDILSPNN